MLMYLVRGGNQNDREIVEAASRKPSSRVRSAGPEALAGRGRDA